MTKISVRDVELHMQQTSWTYASTVVENSAGVPRTLYLNGYLDGKQYEVIHGGEVLLETTCLKKAVDFYNSMI